jgi:hypothetical protein
MKKLKVFLPIMMALVGVLFFAQCKKDHSCNMRVTCYYSEDGMNGDSVVPFALISFDTVKYNAGLAIDPAISSVQDVPTNASGVFTYTLKYPALLIVNAVKYDTIDGIAKKYTGTTQVQVNEGETTDKTILMVETN